MSSRFAFLGTGTVTGRSIFYPAGWRPPGAGRLRSVSGLEATWLKELGGRLLFQHTRWTRRF